MPLGTNIKKLREEKKMTQEGVASELGVSFQAVSSWERDEYKPDMDNLMKLADLFEVSLSNLVEEKSNHFKTNKTIYDWKHMKTYLKASARNFKLNNTLKALDYAIDAHDGQKRKKSDIPYIYHPLNLACHSLALNIIDDEIIAACLLHDVVEDCGKTIDELPVNDEVKKLVSLLTREKTNDDNRDIVMKKYFKNISNNPKAALIKCLDRCNNLTTMSWGLSKERIYRTIKETEEYIPNLIKILKNTTEYSNAAWLLQYQIESMLDIYKRLM